MTFADKVLAFYQSLELDKSFLPTGIDLMNPFRDPNVMDTTRAFYQKFYADQQPRYMVIGINPGRFGGGTTGIPFTDPNKLKKYCGIDTGRSSASELSADFIYAMINAYGGAGRFYAKFFLTAVSPLGFVKEKNGKLINYNYYDTRELLSAVRGFIMETLRKQLDFGICTDMCFCLGTGKNYEFLSKVNDQHHYFKEIVPLSHPRFIMQYRRSKLDEFIQAYLEAFSRIK